MSKCKCRTEKGCYAILLRKAGEQVTGLLADYDGYIQLFGSLVLAQSTAQSLMASGQFESASVEEAIKPVLLQDGVFFAKALEVQGIQRVMSCLTQEADQLSTAGCGCGPA